MTSVSVISNRLSPLPAHQAHRGGLVFVDLLEQAALSSREFNGASRGAHGPTRRSNGWATFQFDEAFEYNGVENLLVVPGAVHIPWRTDYEPVPNDVCDRRARWLSRR